MPSCRHTLNEDKFASLTRGGSLADTLAGLDAAWNAGFRGTKLNAVLLGGVNADEIPALAQLAQDGKYEVRFIELMPIGECADWPRERFLSADAVLHALPESAKLKSRRRWSPNTMKKSRRQARTIRSLRG